METGNLKEKVFSGIIWRFGERISAQLVSFAVSVVLARLLTPAEFGTVATIMIFIEIANVFVVNGFGSALVQKKEVDSEDFSTVFYFNLIFSLLICAILCFSSEYIAEFYGNQSLKWMIRVMSIKIPLAAINSIQQAMVQRLMIFRKFFFSTIIGTILSAFVGIFAAYLGVGTWALILQYLVNSLMDTIVLWFTVKWRPTLEFSWKKLKSLFNFGSKILASALLHTVYVNLRSLVIGKRYSSEDLAFYNQGQRIPQLVGNNINTAVTSVLFPAMSKVQDEKTVLKNIVRKSIRTASIIMCPVCIGIIAVSDQLITLLFTTKWIACVPFLCIAATEYIFEPIQMTNLQAIKAMGRSDLTLKMEIIKKTYGIIAIIFSMKYGVFAIALAGLSQTFVALLVNTYPNKKLLGYSYYEQVADILPSLIPAGIMGIAVYIIGVTMGTIPIQLQLLIQVLLGIGLYIILLFFFRRSEFYYVTNMVKGFLKK